MVREGKKDEMVLTNGFDYERWKKSYERQAKDGKVHIHPYKCMCKCGQNLFFVYIVLYNNTGVSFMCIIGVILHVVCLMLLHVQ